MPAATQNVTPIFPSRAHLVWQLFKDGGIGADTTGTHANVHPILLAGGWLEDVQAFRLRPCGTNPASMMRFFVGNGLGGAGNFCPVFDVVLPATVASTTVPMVEIDLIRRVRKLAFPPTYLLYAGTTTDLSAADGWKTLISARRFAIDD